jgi:putative oxidoreductase
LKNWRHVLIWVVLGIASLFFLMGGSQKLAGSDQMVAMFSEMGYPAWFRVAVGLFEIAGAIALLIPKVSLYAAAAFVLLMAGATWSEFTSGRAFEVPLPAFWLVAFGLIVYVKLRTRNGQKDFAEAKR